MSAVEELIQREFRHLPMATHLDIKKAYEAGQIAAIREYRFRVISAVNSECSCGGAPKGTIGCAACSVYHRVFP